METNKIVAILQEVDINLLLKPKFQKAVLADLLYEYETERKVLNTINNSVNVVKKLVESKNKQIEIQNIKKELLSFGLDEKTIEWALNIWAKVLKIDVVTKEKDNLSFSLGGSFTLALYDNKRVFAWGNNRYGQLGINNLIDYVKLQEITNNFDLSYNESIESIEASFRSSYLLTTFGRIFAWGDNQYGQLADKSIKHSFKPLDITSQFKLIDDEKIIKISSNGLFALLLTSKGRIFAWGNNEYGQLGDGTFVNKSKPINITPNINLYPNETIKDILTGLGHSILITSLSRVFSWGSNKYGQLGLPNIIKNNVPVEITNTFMLNEDEKIQSVAVGALHTIFITNIGRVFTCGNNEEGQLGDTTMKNSNTPIDITKHFNTNQKIIKIAAGKNFSLALTNSGEVFAWGNNNYGQLGISDYITNSTGPLKINDYINLDNNEYIIDIISASTSTHVYAISSVGNIYAWGNNNYGQLGEGLELDGLSLMINII